MLSNTQNTRRNSFWMYVDVDILLTLFYTGMCCCTQITSLVLLGSTERHTSYIQHYQKLRRACIARCSVQCIDFSQYTVQFTSENIYFYYVWKYSQVSRSKCPINILLNFETLFTGYVKHHGAQVSERACYIGNTCCNKQPQTLSWRCP